MEMDLFSSPGEQPTKKVPLAERLRPHTLDEVIGQEHLIGPGKPLTLLKDNLPNLIFWGPPGVGKTTLARILAGGKKLYSISAVLDGVGELRKTVEEIRRRGGGAVVFIDEIHRWNKAQQDSLLPHLEDGTITLIGATTENPSFSLIAPLLSRAKVFVLKPLEEKHLSALLERALTDREHGLGAKFCRVDDDAKPALIAHASGDGRRLLNLLEMACNVSHEITLAILKEVLDKKVLRHDKSGDQHYDIISAFIKSMRGSDPDAALYYLARMYEAGDDPRFLARRMIIFASEDIGMADPRALPLAVSAAEAFDRVGQAEGWIPLAHVAVYLALAPKSNSTYAGYKAAKALIEETGDLPVPLHLRNAATEFMKKLGYGEGYEYAHSQEDARVTHTHLPEEAKGSRFYHPSKFGFEKAIFKKEGEA